ncbi:MAG: alpha/beta fold hydrolase [Proteobacteria bacterium]|nr:alpha/beta fold hydrolase [Pseudomonadota bacterium]
MKKIILICFILVGLLVAGFMTYSHMNPEKVFVFTQNLERGAAHLAVKSTTINGIDIRYLDGGKGPALVLIHGFGADKDNWTRVSKYLTGHFRVIAPDLPGFGESSKLTDLDYSLSAQAQRLHDFVSALGLKKIHLGGSSMGGAISGVYASMYPDQVESLWLVAPGAVNAPEQSDLGKALMEGKNPLINETPEEFDTTLDFVFYKKPYIPSSIMAMLARQSVAEKAIKDIVFKAIITDKTSIDTLLTGSTIPTLVLWGDHDRCLHVSGAGVLCEKMANATCVIMESAGHLPMIERPEEAAEAFLAFQGIANDKNK